MLTQGCCRSRIPASIKCTSYGTSPKKATIRRFPGSPLSQTRHAIEYGRGGAPNSGMLLSNPVVTPLGPVLTEMVRPVAGGGGTRKTACFQACSQACEGSQWSYHAGTSAATVRHTRGGIAGPTQHFWFVTGGLDDERGGPGSNGAGSKSI